MSQTQPALRLLLVEDDPISRSFLHDALSALPAEVDVAEDIAHALALAGRHRHALWLVDAHLPDGDGLDALRALRALHDTPALAITAGAAREHLDALCASGYLEVLLKPVSVAALQSTVWRLLGHPGRGVREPDPVGKLPLWDESRALLAMGGNIRALAQLRGMFQAELPALREQLAQARGHSDTAAMQALLHKLKASCAFVGAARLNAAVHQLALAPDDDQAWLRFHDASEDALAWTAPQF